ncbi:MAG: T9SS type A sorting domain-containing protein [Bacteroidetes bacterium]|nr:T9SS type A sorting domain-containing protein [Bacteroidota bacterium]
MSNDLIVFPNPTEDALQITWTSTETEDVSFILSDYTGKTLWKQTRSFTEGKQTMPLTLQGFATGSYLLQIKMADDSYFIKVIKK